MLKSTFFAENSDWLDLKTTSKPICERSKDVKRRADLEAPLTSICGTMTESIKAPNFEDSDKYLVWSNVAILGIVSSAFDVVS